ncbi:MAG: tRNA (5-methylaminomethyl-2-thiouridine)(34)-methyltransferase MnmD [Flavobacteriales bacterium]|nr:tRNA (5-methylaminomethyl-2-thiouridine)(34)-methyltransferase MnmD [Flavobacteriales bacterium]
MQKELITTSDGSHSFFVPSLNETYHSKHGAIAEAKHVFIENGLMATNKNKVNILEVGFGTGLNTLLTLQKAKEQKLEVFYNCLEPYPLKKEEYSKLNFTNFLDCPKENLMALHNGIWEKEIQLQANFTLLKNKVAVQIFTTNKKIDIIYFDAFAPEKQPEMWRKSVFKKMYNYLKDDGFLVTYCAKGVVKRTMKAVGFEIIVLDGPPGKRQMTRANKKGS